MKFDILNLDLEATLELQEYLLNSPYSIDQLAYGVDTKVLRDLDDITESSFFTNFELNSSVATGLQFEKSLKRIFNYIVEGRSIAFEEFEIFLDKEEEEKFSRATIDQVFISPVVQTKIKKHIDMIENATEIFSAIETNRSGITARKRFFVRLLIVR